MPIIASTMEVGRLLPEGLPWSVIGIVVTVVVGVVYTVVSRERPLTGFPLATLEGQSPRKSWLQHGRQTMLEALNKVYQPGWRALAWAAEAHAQKRARIR